jgi:hypothetical protein
MVRLSKDGIHYHIGPFKKAAFFGKICGIKKIDLNPYKFCYIKKSDF